MTKLCPFCAEEIQAAAIKCRYCGEFMSKPAKDKWFQKPWGILIVFLTFGPLALPLVWFNPTLSMTKRIVYTVIIVVLSVLIIGAIVMLLQHIAGYYKEAFELVQ